MSETDQETIFLSFFIIFLILVLAFIVRREERDWGEMPTLAVLLAFMGLIAFPMSIAFALASTALATTWVAVLLALLAAGSIVVGFLARWIRPLLLFAATIFLLAAPAVASVIR